ncbi:hypothetical protein CULC0102_0124 [Corynebacterium ulcerans 0102]|nr:hypothetical protein CULC0102_0124 [Corynebacterium ulcerans 0102]
MGRVGLAVVGLQVVKIVPIATNARKREIGN